MIISIDKAGEKPKAHQRAPRRHLTMTKNWKQKINLGKQLQFPESIIMATLRPDIVLLSESLRQVVMLDLTVHW